MESKNKNKFANFAKLFFASVFFVSIASMVLAFLATPVSALVGPDVRVVSSSFSNELTPGATTDVTLKLASLGVFPCAYKVTTQISVSPPLSIDGLDSKIIGEICAPNETTVSFAVKADANAPVASYPINFVTTYESEYRATYAAYNTVYASVKGSPKIAAHVTKSNPVTIYPDNDFSLDIAIDNVGAFRADSLTLSLAAEAPLEVRQSTKTQTAATLQPRTSTTKTFYFHAPKNAPARSYALTLTAQYINENGETSTTSIPLSIEVGKKALFEASDGTTVTFIDSRNNELRFSLKNVGSDSAKRVRAMLLPAFPFSTQGSVQYTDDIPAGSQKELVFYVDVDKGGVPGEYSMDLSVTYENADGDQFSDTIPVGVKTDYTPLLNTIFLNYWYAWLIAAAAAVYFVSRRRKAQAKDKEAKEKTKAK